MSQHMLMRNESSWPLLKLHRNMHRVRNYPVIANTQQAMFDYIAFGEKAVAPPSGALEADKAALAAFPPPPKRRVNPAQGPWTPDPTVDVINAWGPLIAELIGRPGEFDPLGPQALDPFPVEERCVTGFRWQSRPYEICGGDDATFEYPGEDYLVAYWMGRWFGFLSEAD